MSVKLLVVTLCALQLCSMAWAGGHGGGHKKVVIHVPYKVHHHHHKHTITKHIHHKPSGGGDDHYEVLGYTYGQPKAAPHGGHGWHAAEESQDSYGQDSPVSFGGDHGYEASAADSGAAGGEYNFGSSASGGEEYGH